MRKFNVNVNGKSYFVEVEEAGASETSAVIPAAPVQSAAPAPAPAAETAGGSTVKSPMPGLILKFTAPAGSKVKKGDKIIVLEAMKMENDIVASADGVVTYLVKLGDNVTTNAILASIK